METNNPETRTEIQIQQENNCTTIDNTSDLREKCKSRLISSILVSVLLFPVAIAAIVKSAIAIKEVNCGNREKAEQLYKDAKRYINISIVLGIINYILVTVYIVCETILLVESINSYNSYDY